MDENNLKNFLSLLRPLCTAAMLFSCSFSTHRRTVPSVQYQQYTRNAFTGYVELESLLCVEPDDRLALDRTLTSRNEFGPNQYRGGRMAWVHHPIGI